METNGYRLLLPEGTLDYFNISAVKESGTEIVIYLEEKNGRIVINLCLSIEIAESEDEEFLVIHAMKFCPESLDFCIE